MDAIETEAMFDASGRLQTGWRAVAASALGLACGPSVLLVMCFGVFLPSLRHAFGWTVGQASFGALVISLTIGVISPVQGMLADRFGSRRLILTSMPLFGLGFAGLSLMNGSLPLFYASCAALAVLGLGCWPLSYMRLATTWFDRRLGAALGLVNAGMGVGAAASPLLIAMMMAAWGWRAAYAVLGLAVVVVATPVLAVWAREPPNTAAPIRDTRRAPTGLAVRTVVRQRSFWLLCVGFCMLGVWSSGMLIHQVSILLDRGFTSRQAVAAQSVLGVSSIAGRLAVGWLLDRVSVRKLMPAMMLLAAAVCWLYAAASGSVLFVGAAACGFIIGAEFDVCGYAIRRFHGLRSFGTTYGLIFAAFQVGGASGAYLMGALRDRGSYTTGLGILAGTSLACGAAFVLLGRYRFDVHSVGAHSVAAAPPSLPSLVALGPARLPSN